jgi:hypothetical protein
VADLVEALDAQFAAVSRDPAADQGSSVEIEDLVASGG